MRFTRSLQSLSDDLAELLVRGARVEPDEVPAAVVARDAVLSSVADPYSALAGVSATAVRKPTLDAAASHPVALLRYMLEQRILMFPDEPSPAPSSVAAAMWASAGRNATFLQHAWTTSERDSWPTGASRWTLLADLASVVEAVALLDRSLTTNMGANAQLPSGLALAAREVRTLAAAGELTAVPEPRQLASQPIRVRGLADLAGGQLRLVELLRAAEDIDPANMRAIVLAHRRSLIAIAAAIAGQATTNEADRISAPGLRDHATLLGLPSDRGVASLRPGDPRPLAQAAEIAAFTAGLPQQRPATTSDHSPLAAAARSTLYVSGALNASAERQLRTGRWLVPDAEAVALRWRRAAPGAEPPRMVTALQQAAAHARQLLDEGRSNAQRPAQYVPGRLVGVLSAGRERPQEPGGRPAAAF